MNFKEWLKEYGKVTFFLFIVLGLFGLGVLYLFNAHIQIDNALEDTCNRIGYKELTDKKQIRTVYGSPKFKIECDYKVVTDIFECKGNNKCLEFNKWSNCVKREKGYLCEFI